MSETFHFLRPYWFLAMVPLALMVWRIFSSNRHTGFWRKVCDSALLPFILVTHGTKQSKLAEIIFTITMILLILALAGPAWKKLPQPLFSKQAPLVIVLDLSLSMNAKDIAPTRLIRAKLKIEDILSQRKEGTTALVVYTEHAFSVTPLTEDRETIRLQLKNISTETVPVQGSRAELGLKKAERLMFNSKIQSGDILLITDEVADNDVLINVKSLVNKNIRLSVLAMGTDNGAPIPDQRGGFLKENGNIIVAKTNFKFLEKMAQLGNGYYTRMTLDDSDVVSLNSFFATTDNALNIKRLSLSADIWQEEGPWLLLIILLLASLSFRKGWIMVLSIMVMIPNPQPVYALDWASVWSGLWFNNDQQGLTRYQQEKYDEAAEKFKHKNWKASAYYKSGNYKKAIENWRNDFTAEGDYNRGNALARQYKLKQAISSYNRALKKNPGNKDARYNRDLLKRIMQKFGNQKGPGKSGENKGQQQGKKGKTSDQNQKNQQGKNKKNSQQGKRSEQNKTGSKNTQLNSPQGQQTGSNLDGKSNPKLDSKTGKPKPQNKQSQQGDKKEKNKDKMAKGKAKSDKEKRQAKQKTKGAKAKESQVSELDQAYEQWLRRIPDDPGALLRRKFQRQYRMEKRASPYEFNSLKKW